MKPFLERNPRALAAALFDAGVVQVNVRHPFRLTSGESAPVYIDHRRIFSHPELRRALVDAWAETLASALPKGVGSGDVVVAGTATAGIAPAYALAETWGARFVYVRSKPKEHGLARLVEGDLPAAAMVVAVDDMVTTGGSLLQAVDALAAVGCQLVIAAAITTHGRAQAQAEFAARNLKLATLFHSRDIFRWAHEQGRIDASDWKCVDEWLESRH